MDDVDMSIEPRSDQVNADDFLAGPMTVTITEVRTGNAEQPVQIHLAEFPGRPFKPSKTVRRVLVAAWGKHASEYVGRRMTLFCDPAVRWAGVAVGGIRVSHASHIAGPVEINLTVTRSKRELFVLQPLADTISDRQISVLRARIKEHELDQAAAQQLCTQEAGRPIAGLRDLTAAEADLVIAALPPKPGDPS